MVLRQGLIVLALAGVLHFQRAADAAAQSRVTFLPEPGRLIIQVDGRPMGTYVYQDEEILRPYFSNLKAPGGVQVTRNHPPIIGKDKDDHASMHPGLWLAFGDMDGHDFWRNKGTVRHDRFLDDPTSQGNQGEFTVLNQYVAQERTVCEETCRIAIEVLPEGYLILWESAFSAQENAFAFGDQEEMGLGVRLATSIAVRSGQGGRILDDQGRRNEKAIWGKETLWCDYAGPVGDAFAGIMIMPSPGNASPCRWHVRDYGFMAANPFAKKAFNAGPAAKTVVPVKKSLTLCFGIFLHSAQDETALDLEQVYQEYLKRER